MDPKSVHQDHRRLLHQWPQQNAARLFHRLKFHFGRKTQSFSQGFGKDDATRFVYPEFHTIDYAICHALWQSNYPEGSRSHATAGAALFAALAAAFSCFCASASSLRKIRIPLSTCFSCSRNGGKKRSTVSWVTLISRPLASAPSRIGFPAGDGRSPRNPAPPP